MSKIKVEPETNWVEVDKRIRARRPNWTLAEVETLDQGLKRLPDVAAKADELAVEQPAIGPRSPMVGADHETEDRTPEPGDHDGNDSN